MEHLRPLDSFFLDIEVDQQYMTTASFAVFDGTAPRPSEIAAAIEGKLPLVPRYRQRLRAVPFRLGLPVWVDDARFDVHAHLRHVALPSPGGRRELDELVGDAMSYPLAPDRPLWDCWIVEGLTDDRWGILTRVHHCMIDGITGADLSAVMLDLTPAPSPPLPDDHVPEAPPSILRLVRGAAGGAIGRVADIGRETRSVARVLGGPLPAARGLAGGTVALLSHMRNTRATSLNGGVGPYRKWTGRSVPLADVQAVRRALGGTVNDAVVATVTAGYRELLLSEGRPVDDVTVRALVPVNVRDDGERGTPGNRVSGMLVDLPVGIADPVERLHKVSMIMAARKESHEVEVGRLLTATIGLLAPPAQTALNRATSLVANRVPLHSINTVVTNVPGPQFPLYFLGREMLEVYPYVPLGSGMRSEIAVFSYNGRIGYGISGDDRVGPDLDVLAKGIDAGLSELLDAATQAVT